MKTSKHWKKGLEISFNKSVPKIMIICYTVPEIWHVLDVIAIFHFGQFSALLPPSTPPPLTAQEMKLSQKWKKKKTSGGIIIYHKCTKNHDHMLYCSWDVVCDRCNCYFSFGAIFCPFNPLIAQKMNISNNEKSTWRYHHFTKMYQR